MRVSTASVGVDRVGGGRLNQKRRTRQALVQAALVLSEEGRPPTLQRVAEEALVSRATAYRYFPSAEALLYEAHLERVVRSMERALRPGDDLVEATSQAARAINRLLLQNEMGLHVIERSFMQVWLDNPAEARPPRPGRRMEFIDPIVAALAEKLGPGARARLRTALALTMGAEAVLSMRDVAGATAEAAIEVGGWAARALVLQALAEAAAGQRRLQPGRPRGGRSGARTSS